MAVVKSKAKSTFKLTSKARVMLDDLLSLPRNQRLLIANTLNDSVLEEDGIPGLSEEWKAELDRRVALSEADPSRLIPWEVVKARLDEFCKKVNRKRA